MSTVIEKKIILNFVSSQNSIRDFVSVLSKKKTFGNNTLSKQKFLSDTRCGTRYTSMKNHPRFDVVEQSSIHVLLNIVRQFKKNV